MGACFSCCTEEESRPAGDSNERTHLLDDPVSNSSNNIHRIQSDEYLSRNINSVTKHNDEQSAINKILQETATNVIDVAALDTHDLDQHEYYERMRSYTARLNGLGRWSPPDHHKKLLIDVPAPEKILAADPISLNNLRLITEALDKASQAVSQICVEHKDDLVVPFRIP